MEWLDWFYLGIIGAQTAMLFVSSYWLSRCRKLIDKQTAALQQNILLLTEASQTIMTLRQQVRELGGKPYFPKEWSTSRT